ncbi:MAG: division/cell wall cluster transcriptional repressor MraZ [Janthinobacterium lividum]
MTNESFLGHSLNAVDAKSRLSIPSAFRDVIVGRSESRTVVVSLHERATCLVGYDARRPAKLQSEVEARFAGDYGDARDNHVRAAFGTSEMLPIDDTGRIVLSANMKDLAEIERSVLFWGMGEFFEIWNPRLFLENPGVDPRLVRLVRRQLEAKGEA